MKRKTEKTLSSPNGAHPAKALLTVAVMAAGADGKLGRKELSRLRLMAREQPALRDFSQCEDYLAHQAQNLTRDSMDRLLHDCRQSLTPRMRETAYAWAALIIQEDGAQHQSEHAFLNKLSDTFGIPGPLTAKIDAVVALLRRAS